MSKLTKEERKIMAKAGVASNKGKGTLTSDINFGWFSVNPGYVVVKKGLITGSIEIKKTGSLHFRGPFSTAERLYVGSRQCDYKAKKYATKNGLEVMIDVALEFDIASAEKYVTIENPEGLVKTTIESLLTDYIKTKTYEELQEQNSLKLTNVGEFKEEFNNFLNNYGINVLNLKVQNLIIANETVRRQYEDAAAQEKENISIKKRAEAEAEALKLREKAKATVELEVLKLVAVEKAKIETEVNEKLINSIANTIAKLKKEFDEKGIDISMEELARIAHTSLAINSKNQNVRTHVIVGGTGSSLENSAMIYNTEKPEKDNNEILKLQELQGNENSFVEIEQQPSKTR